MYLHVYIATGLIHTYLHSSRTHTYLHTYVPSYKTHTYKTYMYTYIHIWDMYSTHTYIRSYKTVTMHCLCAVSFKQNILMQYVIYDAIPEIHTCTRYAFINLNKTHRALSTAEQQPYGHPSHLCHQPFRIITV